jgi:hypothetical protein
VGNFFTLRVGFVEHDHAWPKLADRRQSHSSLLSGLAAGLAPSTRKRERYFLFAITILGTAILGVAVFNDVTLNVVPVVLPLVCFVTQMALQVRYASVQWNAIESPAHACHQAGFCLKHVDVLGVAAKQLMP